MGRVLRVGWGAALAVSAGVGMAASTLDAADVTWVNRFADEMATRCAARFSGRLASVEGDVTRLRLIEMERRVNCECLPTRLRVHATADVVAALRAREVAPSRAFMIAHARVCGAQGLRDSAELNCRVDAREAAFVALNARPPTGEERASLAPLDAAGLARCRCFAAGVAALDDDTLIAEAEAAYSAFQARLDDPASAPHQGIFAALKQACAAPAE